MTDPFSPAEAASPGRADWGPAIEFLSSGSSFALTTHINSDGDGLGCQSALARALLAMGKKVRILNPTRIEHTYAYLVEGLDLAIAADRAEADSLLPADCDRSVILDVSTRRRTGAMDELFRARDLPELVIDHHVSSEYDGSLCYIFPDSGSTGEVLYELLSAMGAPIDSAIATALYTAIYTDTGGFANTATSARNMEIAASLVRQGADPVRIYDRLHQQHPLGRYRLMGRMMDGIRSLAGGRINAFTISRAMFRETGTGREHTEGFVNLGLNIAGSEVAILMTEVDEFCCKISFRSKGRYDVNALAGLFGGGGHHNAAGATIQEPLAVIQPRILQAAEAMVAGE